MPLHPLAVVVALAPAFAFASEAPCPTASTASPTAIRVDHTAVDSDIPDEYLEKARQLSTAIAHPTGTEPLVVGLAELAKESPRYSYRGRSTTDSRWYAQGGGIGDFSVGKNHKPDLAVDDFVAAMNDKKDIGDNVGVSYFKLGASDLPSGNHIEVVYVQRRVTMDIRQTHSTLDGVYTDQINAPTLLGGGTLGGAIFPGSAYPIELPNLGVTSLSTTAMVPAGGYEEDLVPKLSQRDPRLAFAKYRDAMEALEKAHPAVAMVWSTVPLSTENNEQRNWYNFFVREHARTNGKMLFDVADIQSHDQSTVEHNPYRENLSADYAQRAHGPDMNAVGRQRLAKAWWSMLARIGGWKPEG